MKQEHKQAIVWGRISEVKEEVSLTLEEQLIPSERRADYTKPIKHCYFPEKTSPSRQSIKAKVVLLTLL